MRKLLAVLLSFIATVSFISCGGDKNSSSQSGLDDLENSPTETVCDLIEDGYFYIGDFETKRQCIEIGITRSMKKGMNADKTYVTRGDYSLRFELWPHAYDAFGGEITFNPSYSTYFTKTDFSDCEYFCFDLYVEKGVDFCKIRPRVLNKWDYEFRVENLVQGWNYVEFPLTEFICTENEEDTRYDPAHAGTNFSDKITKININFPAQDYVQVYYIDNVRYKLKGE